MPPSDRPANVKCARCSYPIEDSDLVVFQRGDYFHQLCWRGPPTTLRRAESGQSKQQSRSVVLCVRCGQGIVSTDEYAMSDEGPVHRAGVCPRPG